MPSVLGTQRIHHKPIKREEEYSRVDGPPPRCPKVGHPESTLYSTLQGIKAHTVHSTSGTLGVYNIRMPDELVGQLVKALIATTSAKHRVHWTLAHRAMSPSTCCCQLLCITTS